MFSFSHAVSMVIITDIYIYRIPDNTNEEDLVTSEQAQMEVSMPGQ